MYRPIFNTRTALIFTHFTRKSYALFNCLGKEVLIGTLSVATLTHAKADGIAKRGVIEKDSLRQKEVKLGEVVVNGAWAPLAEQKPAMIVSVTTADDIQRAAAESVNDVLKSATGVDVRQRGGFGVQTDISINGGTFDQTVILLNGINISNPQTGHNAADFPVSLSDIQRIEVLEGASARVFGNPAFSGAINIVTKSKERSNAFATVEGGSFGTVSGEAGVTLNSRTTNNRLGGGISRSDGGTKNSGFIKRRLFYQGNLSTRHADMMWQTGVTSQDYGASTFYSAKFDNQYEETRRYLASVNADIKPFGDRRFVLSPAIYGHRSYDHFQLTRGKTGADNGENYHRMDVYGATLNARLSWAAGQTTAGAGIRREHILSTAYGDLLDGERQHGISGSTRSYDHEGKRTCTDLFIEHYISLGSFRLSAGVTADRNTGLDNSFRLYPGVDASYRPDKHWTIFASWNKAMRIPTYTELYANSAAQKGSTALKPERNTTMKAGVRYIRPEWEATAYVTRNHGRELIDWVYESKESTKYEAMNIGKVDNTGVACDLTVRPDLLTGCPIFTRLKVGYGYISQKHTSERDIYRSLYALDYLRHKLSVQLDHRIWSRLTAHWSMRWQQRMNGYHPYAKLDAKLSWTAERYDIYLKADNITNHRYYDIGSVLQPGIWVMAGAKVKMAL